MSQVTEQDIANHIASISLFDTFGAKLGELSEIGMLQSVLLVDNQAKIAMALGFPCETALDSYSESIKASLIKHFPSLTIHLDVGWYVPQPKQREGVGLVSGVRHIIAVASGKGGVGKSTTAINIALALLQEGARVGILDADIYGPSQPLMLGMPPETRPEVIDEKNFRPVVAHGLQTISMGYLVTEKTPMVWRGPMVSGALEQLLGQTLWKDLDYLIIDMPPGTGDIQLTLSQRVPVSGAVIVTTPQDIALLDAKKGVEMFRKVELPVLGVVENMATHVCTKCGHEEHIFGAGGAARIAREYAVDVLGSLPLDLSIREHADAGSPSVVIDPEGSNAQQYRSIARRAAANLAQTLKRDQAGPTISVVND